MNKILATVIALVVILGIGFFVMPGTAKPAPSGDTMMPQDENSMPDQSTNQATGTTTPTQKTGTPTKVALNYKGLTAGSLDEKGNIVVLYTGDGFVPSQLTIYAGRPVRFINLDNLALQIEAIEYKDGKAYPDFLSPKAFGYGNDYVFTFTETGVWSYRNQLAKQNIGTLVVKAQ